MQFVFVVDGGPSQGFGHLVRMRTIAHVLVERSHEVTLCTRTPEAARSVFDTVEQVSISTLPTTAGVEEITETVLEYRPDVTVVDYPDVGLPKQQHMSNRVPALVLVRDDIGETVCCDLLVNSHIYANVDDYEWKGEEPTWCVGPKYQIFDKKFSECLENEPPWRKPPERALVTLGGSDVTNTTPVAISALDGHNLEIDVVVGPGFENVAAIEQACAETDSMTRCHHDPDQLAELMFQADLAVAALGLTAYELLVMGTPFVGLVAASDQRPKARALHSADAVLLFEDIPGEKDLTEAVERLRYDDALRRRLRERGRALIDPDGADRVCDALESL